ncbi:MAG: hypothetical protein QNJ05_01950 [Woeseiaceae bacterium]|nr:hypothetical protein [Woeseiaceae bacterium]
MVNSKVTPCLETPELPFIQGGADGPDDCEFVRDRGSDRRNGLPGLVEIACLDDESLGVNRSVSIE